MKLLVTGAWKCTQEQLNKLKALGHVVVFMQNEKDLLPCSYEEVEGVICNGLFLHHPIERFSALRYIQLTSAGFDRVPMDDIKARGIQIHNARGVYSIPMAEFAISGVLQLYKQSRFFYENQKKSVWEKQRGVLELYGKKVCIVGCGSVGTECAKRFQAFGCRVVGVDLYSREDNAYEKIYALENLDEALSQADIVVLTLPLTEETRHIINAGRFEKMKDGSVLVNIARGAVVDEHALLRAVDERLLGAVLDVFEEEPLSSDNPLWKKENVIVTPHNSFVGDGNGDRLYQVIVENLEKVDMTREKIKEIVEKKHHLRDKLFSFGFLLTDNSVEEKQFPFFGDWEKADIEHFTLLIHKKQKYYIEESQKATFCLIGHAYNPFSFEHNEKKILRDLISEWEKSTEVFFEKLNEISGIFTLIILGEETWVIGDPTGIQTCFYGNINGKFYASSHCNLIGDLCGLDVDGYVKKLKEYKYFPLFGNLLPGDLSPFKEIKRLVPNHYVRRNGTEFYVKRFFTIKKIENDNEIIAGKVARILQDSLKLIAKKWDKPAISLTGGCDSKTTLSCAKGIYDQFNYFSYISSDTEKVDAEAAHEISESLEIPHHIHNISQNDGDFEDLEDVREILYWNGGGVLYNNSNDIRKRCYYSKVDSFDVEIKSWCSEIGRAYYSKRFNNRKNFGKKATPRKCTTLYKIFLQNRKLAKQTDAVFAEYLEKYFQIPAGNEIPWQEHFFWEYRVAAWNGVTITGEHRYSFDITIPYNNRKLLCLLLSASIENRINDTVYKRIREMMNSDIDKTGIAVQNVKHTKIRAKIENLYYIIHSRLPF